MMYFQKLENLRNEPGISLEAIKKLDSWLAAKPSNTIDFLNPLDFSCQEHINEKISLKLFSICSDLEVFEKYDSTPLLRLKYIINCPNCDKPLNTFYSTSDFPNDYITCNDDCEGFYPVKHPERIEIYFELLDSPKIDDRFLRIYDSPPTSPPLTANHEAVKEVGLWGALMNDL